MILIFILKRRKAKFEKIGHIFSLHEGLLFRSVTQKIGNSSVLYRKKNEKPFRNENLYKLGCLAVVIPHESKQSEESIIS